MLVGGSPSGLYLGYLLVDSGSDLGFQLALVRVGGRTTTYTRHFDRLTVCAGLKHSSSRIGVTVTCGR